MVESVKFEQLVQLLFLVGVGNHTPTHLAVSQQISYASFTLSPKQHKTTWEWEWEGYIRLISHILTCSHLATLRKMLVNCTRHRIRMSYFIIEDTVIYTLFQFSNIIYLVLEKIVNFF